uniref:manganese efflux pump MntP n=1 Tax=uncultured Akkermansia sp. TaxID=512294 RepID=UPI00262B5B09
FGLLAFLGGKTIAEGLSHKDGKAVLRTKRRAGAGQVILQAIATSIDALVAGVSIYLSSAQCGTGPTLHAVLLPAAAIGLTTFLCTAAGFFLTGRLHRFPTFHLEAGAGLILIGLGVKMLCDHLC